jgi:hypothetical protein
MTRLPLILGIIALPALANAQAVPGDRLFQMIDADASGTLTAAEIDAFKTAQFARADTNGDGLLDEAERTALRESRAAEARAAVMAQMDSDGDGAISLPEFLAFSGLRQRLDADGDGSIARAEFDLPN